MIFVINSMSPIGTLPEAATGKSEKDSTSQSHKDNGFGCESRDEEEGNKNICQNYRTSSIII